MGTSATIRFKYEGDNLILVNVYHHYDGYIDGVGHDLAEFLLSKKIVNGISSFDDKNKIANGFGCLIAQYISNVKEGPCNVYIYPQDFEGDYNYDVVYNNWKDEMYIKVTHYDKVLFKGSPKELLEYKKEADEGEDEDMIDKEIINNEKYHTCGRCKYENTPDGKYPCIACTHGTDHRTDLWELKQESEYDHDHDVIKAYNDGQAFILDMLRKEIEQIGATEQEINGKTDYLKGITTCLDIIDKYGEVNK